MTSMDSYYSTSTAQGRDHQFRTFPTAETKYSPTFIPGKGQPYAERSRSPFQQECQSLDGAEESTFNKYQLFMQRPSCKTPPEGSKLHPDSGLNGTLVPCYGECGEDKSPTGRKSGFASAPLRGICNWARKKEKEEKSYLIYSKIHTLFSQSVPNMHKFGIMLRARKNKMAPQKSILIH
ncbi:unnamed protein product [Tetraodon nigroviridis]|uniref:(spotted green pufferfish) hypothetical protein n=1 Tax=Tetraodon nigroviridis TaxID=99883 RepID=Q4RSA1_TETNG|nr:unnamed protein product [Tetraodon nigroviridis]